MSEEQPALAISNMSFSYGAPTVLQDVNLTVARNSMMSIIGPNGGGKTTLLKLILGLLSPNTGSISILGDSPANARGHIGYMPQYMNFDTKFPISVIDVVLMGLAGEKRIGWYSKADRARACAALDEVGLAARPSAPFADLSGGQRQRALMARAIVSKPKLLLLDEPTSNIDIESEARLRDILQRLNSRMTILLVSHDIGFVSDFVKTVICVNRKVFLHPTDELTGDMIHGVYSDDVRAIRHDYHHIDNCDHSEPKAAGAQSA